MKVSACVIVKNEAKNLPQWLKCNQALADELIVVDTGSTDDTVEIARKAGARVEFFAWCDDFSAAKNYAMDKASGDWIIFLDADEYFAEEDYEKVKQAIRRVHKNKAILGIACTLVNINTDAHGRQGIHSVQIRLFRNLPELRYKNKVHESLVYSGKGQKTMQFVEGITIYHTGYSSSVLQEKSKRNLELLLKRQTEEGENPMDFLYLADCYENLQDYESAARMARRVIEAGICAVGRETHIYTVWIHSLGMLKKPLDEIAIVTERAEKEYPHAGEFSALYGMAAVMQQDYIRAENALKKSLLRYQTGKQAQSQQQQTKAVLAGDEMTGLLPQVYYQLARLCYLKGKPERALDYLVESLKRNPYMKESCYLYSKLLAAVSDADFILALKQFYKKEDVAFIWQYVVAARRKKVMLYFLQQERELREEEAYYLTDHLPAASAALTEQVQRWAGIGIRAESRMGNRNSDSPLAVLLPGEYGKIWQGGAAETLGERKKEQSLKRMVQYGY